MLRAKQAMSISLTQSVYSSCASLPLKVHFSGKKREKSIIMDGKERLSLSTSKKEDEEKGFSFSLFHSHGGINAISYAANNDGYCNMHAGYFPLH